jgi:hypothetical protein
MIANVNHCPWTHWIADNFLTSECLAELKSIEHTRQQTIFGKRVGNQRMFIDESVSNLYPELYKLYLSLRCGSYKEFFESHTGLDYTDLYPRVEVISDIGDFYLEPHCDLPEKHLTAIVYTDYKKLYPGTGLGNGTRIESRDNRCFFFVPSNKTLHDYPATQFDQIRRCLQINYWTYSL